MKFILITSERKQRRIRIRPRNEKEEI